MTTLRRSAYIANAGPMNPAQRRAMFAKLRGSPAGLPTARNPVQKPSPDLGKPSVPPYIPPGQPGGRPWGESRPGEMYPAVEGPGNPSWERRHPERNPGAGLNPGMRPSPPPAPAPVAPPPVAVPITRRAAASIDSLGGGAPFRRAIQTRTR